MLNHELKEFYRRGRAKKWFYIGLAYEKRKCEQAEERLNHDPHIWDEGDDSWAACPGQPMAFLKEGVRTDV